MFIRKQDYRNRQTYDVLSYSFCVMESKHGIKSVVAYLASIRVDMISNPAHRDSFWEEVFDRADENQVVLTPKMIAKIAEFVPQN